MREFGAPVWILRQGQSRGHKLESKSLQKIFVGFDDGNKSVKYYNPEMHKILTSRCYRFLTLSDQPLPSVDGIEIELAPDVLREGESSRNAPQSDALGSNVQERHSKRHSDDLVESRQIRKKPRVDYQRLNDPFPDERDEVHVTTLTSAEVVYTAFAKQSLGNEDPKTLNEARAFHEWPEWEKAINTELQQLQNMGTWELIDKPPDAVLIANKWVLTKKFNKEGQLIKYKARLVAKGFAQRPGQDYNEMFSPVVCLKTIRAILALVPAKNLRIQQMDVKGAYLNGYLQELVYSDFQN